MSSRFKTSRIALIGYGAIAEEIIRCLETRGEVGTLTGILVRRQRALEAKKRSLGRYAIVDELAALLALEPDIVIEAAGHEAVCCYGADVLRHGTDLLIASVGALAEPALEKDVIAASASGAELWIASGAVAGIDGLLAARTAGLRRVTYTSWKQPHAWTGTAAEPLLARSNAKERVIFFRGSAREAAVQFPKNANVAATIALASLGLDQTHVQLGSDPHVPGPLGVIDAEGDFGRFDFQILALASPSNPKTSALTGHSIIAAVRDSMRFRALDVLSAASELSPRSDLTSHA